MAMKYPKDAQKENFPTNLVIFGVTGDLVAKKIIPALYRLHELEKLPALFQVIGVARRSFSDEEIRSYIKKIVKKNKDLKPRKKLLDEFLHFFTYHQGYFDQEQTYTTLAQRLGKADSTWKTCSNKLFYLSTPPELYQTVFEHLDKSGLTDPCSPEEGWTRVIVEKPFGQDADSAHKLDKLLNKLFKEEQIFRIDHYLGKELLQNLLTFRFANTLFVQSWNKEFIEKIEIRVHEKIGVANRSDLYDTIGALKDVGQNHLLQMLALATMDNPMTMDDVAIRKQRQKVLKSLKRPTPQDIKKTIRGQYVGYRKLSDTHPQSTTETYFKVTGYLDTPQWHGVPIILESGKQMPKQRKEIVVTFKQPPQCFCDPKEVNSNQIIFSLHDDRIIVKLETKQPGFTFETEERVLSIKLDDKRKKGRRRVNEYTRLLYDCFMGDQTLFVSTEEIIAMWKFIDPIVDAWRDDNASPLIMYKPQTLPKPQQHA